MSAEGSLDRKKQVCTTLAGIVKGSPLAHAIDPSAFFMQVNANYGAMVHGHKMDLNLLWASMAAQHGGDAVGDLFLKFADAGAKLGFEVSLPAPLSGLSEAERRARVARLDGGSNPRVAALPGAGASRMPAPSGRQATPGMAGMPAPGMPRAAMPSPSGGLPAPGHGLVPTPRTPLRTEVPADIAHGLIPTPGRAIPHASTPGRGMPAPSEGPASSELTPLPQLFEEYEPTPLSEAAFAGIPDETQRRIISTLVGALKATEAGPHLSAPQLSYFLASRFGVLCDGGHFFFQGVYDAVLELQGVEEKHVYQAAVRFRRWLARIGVQFVEPGWKLDEATRARLEEQAARAPLDTYGSVAKSAAQAPAVPDVPAGPSTAEERQDRRLRAWGLRGLTTRQFALLRGGVGLLIVGVALIVRAALDPVSSLDAGSYQAVIPVTDVLLYEGKWLASLDEKRWRALDATKRGRALKDLAAILQRENRLKGARIIDAKTKGVIGYDLKGTMSLVQPVMELGLEPSRDAPAASASPAASAAPH